jgi:hypothetical protein
MTAFPDDDEWRPCGFSRQMYAPPTAERHFFRKHRKRQAELVKLLVSQTRIKRFGLHCWRLRIGTLFANVSGSISHGRAHGQWPVWEFIPQGHSVQFGAASLRSGVAKTAANKMSAILVYFIAIPH